VPAESFERWLVAAGDNLQRRLPAGRLACGAQAQRGLALEWEPADESPWIAWKRDRIVLPAGFVKGKSDQWVPLHPDLHTALLALPRLGRKVFRFVDRKGRAVSDSAVSDRVISLARRAGVRLSMHALRRGFGCRHAAQVLQKLMRHRNIKTTMDFYANVDDAVMEAVLGPKETRRNTSRNKADTTARNGRQDD
jgi:integrase